MPRRPAVQQAELFDPAAAESPVATEPTKAEFQRWVRLNKSRLKANRHADAAERAMKPLSAKIKAFVEATGGKLRAVVCHDHRAAITSRQSQPSWLEEFRKVAGQEKIDRLKEKAPLRDSLTVEKL